MRIASLQPSITLTLHALGRLDLLCACTRYCIEALPQLAARNLPILQDSWSFDRPANGYPNSAHPSNLDLLHATHPDLVLASVPYRLESLTAILKSGLPVLTLAPHSLANIYNDIRLIAAVSAAPASGQALIDHFTQAVEATRAAATSTHPPLVYCEEWGKPLIHSQHWVAELVTAAGGRFLGEPGSNTTPQQIAAANPDILIFAWCGAGNRVPLEKVIAQRNWQHLTAVHNRRVFCIPDQYLNTPATTLLEGLACIAAAIHPTRFQHAELISLLTHPTALTPTSPIGTL